jgi:hypothetical protein
MFLAKKKKKKKIMMMMMNGVRKLVVITYLHFSIEIFH